MRCEICEMIMSNGKDEPILMAFRESHHTWQQVAGWSGGAVLCHVGVALWFALREFFFLSFPPGYADLSDENIPHLMKVREKSMDLLLTTCPLCFNRRNKSRLRLTGFWWAM